MWEMRERWVVNSREWWCSWPVVDWIQAIDYRLFHPAEAGGIDHWFFDCSIKRETEGHWIEWAISFDYIFLLGLKPGTCLHWLAPAEAAGIDHCSLTVPSSGKLKGNGSNDQISFDYIFLLGLGRPKPVVHHCSSSWSWRQLVGYLVISMKLKAIDQIAMALIKLLCRWKPLGSLMTMTTSDRGNWSPTPNGVKY